MDSTPIHSIEAFLSNVRINRAPFSLVFVKERTRLLDGLEYKRSSTISDLWLHWNIL